MPAIELISSVNTIVNVVIGLWVLPHTFSIDGSGRITSFNWRWISLLTVLLLSANAVSVLRVSQGMIESIAKILLLSCLPLIAAYFMKRFYFSRLPDQGSR